MNDRRQYPTQIRMERSSYHRSSFARCAAAASLGVGVGVAVGGIGVAVGTGDGVAVGGTSVAVGTGVAVLMGGTGVAVGVGDGVLVGETGVGVAVGSGVLVGGTGVAVGDGVLVGGTGVAVAVGDGVALGWGAATAARGGSSRTAVAVGEMWASPQATVAAATPTANMHARSAGGILDALLSSLFISCLRSPSSVHRITSCARIVGMRVHGFV